MGMMHVGDIYAEPLDVEPMDDLLWGPALVNLGSDDQDMPDWLRDDEL